MAIILPNTHFLRATEPGPYMVRGPKSLLTAVVGPTHLVRLPLGDLLRGVTRGPVEAHTIAQFYNLIIPRQVPGTHATVDGDGHLILCAEKPIRAYDAGEDVAFPLTAPDEARRLFAVRVKQNLAWAHSLSQEEFDARVDVLTIKDRPEYTPPVVVPSYAVEVAKLSLPKIVVARPDPTPVPSIEQASRVSPAASAITPEEQADLDALADASRMRKKSFVMCHWPWLPILLSLVLPPCAGA